MNTPAHLLLGAAVLGRRDAPLVTAAAVAGGLMPDLSLYVLTAGALAAGHSAETVFRELYFSHAWQAVFRVDNSALLWGAVLAGGLVGRRAWVAALGSAALLHVGTDLPLHHDDGRAHFWPLTDWVFASPVSYWDAGRGARWIAPIEVALALACAAVLWRRHRAWGPRALVVAAMAAQVSVGGVWAIVLA